MIEPLRISVDVACDAEHAFAGYRGRFGNHVPPVLEHLGLAEVEHGARNNRMRAVT